MVSGTVDMERINDPRALCTTLEKEATSMFLWTGWLVQEKKTRKQCVKEGSSLGVGSEGGDLRLSVMEGKGEFVRDLHF